MIVIADSGSTKTDWRIIIGQEEQVQMATIGFNPFFVSSATVEKELQKEFIKKFPTEKAEKVFFYGAGCSDDFRCSIIELGLKPIFPNAAIFVESDLMAAARATCTDKPGIACILGTGSNSCFYNGEEINDKIPSLGHLLGDEGSGNYMGKMLLRRYFYRELQDDIKIKFKNTFKFEDRALINRMYKDKTANVFFASFSKFIFDNKEHPNIHELINNALSDFVERQILKYSNYDSVPIHFVGSIAHYFKENLENVLSEHRLRLGKVIRKPIDNLVQYHINF